MGLLFVSDATVLGFFNAFARLLLSDDVVDCNQRRELFFLFLFVHLLKGSPSYCVCIDRLRGEWSALREFGAIFLLHWRGQQSSQCCAQCDKRLLSQARQRHIGQCRARSTVCGQCCVRDVQGSGKQFFSRASVRRIGALVDQLACGSFVHVSALFCFFAF